MERLESRSMMAADIVEAAIDFVPDEPTVADQVEDVPADAVEAWGCDLPVCEPQSYDLVDQIFTVDASFIDDACLMVTDPAVPAFEPVDIRVQFVSSETDSSWAAYYYSVGADGLVQGVSVVASYDEPTIAAFVAEHADDPTVQVSDCGDGWWWIGGFPLELAPPVPDAVSWCGFGGGDPAAYESTDVGVWNPSGSFDIASDWSWDGSGVMYTWDQCTWDQAADFGDVGTSTWDGSGVLYAGDWSTSGFGCGVGMIRPLFYARGAGAGESFGDGIVAYSAAADAESGINELSGNVAVAEPVAVSPRAAAFADMGAMAAAATAMQAGSADAPPVGGRRRR